MGPEKGRLLAWGVKCERVVSSILGGVLWEMLEYRCQRSRSCKKGCKMKGKNGHTIFLEIFEFTGADLSDLL